MFFHGLSEWERESEGKGTHESGDVLTQTRVMTNDVSPYRELHGCASLLRCLRPLQRDDDRI